MQSKKPILMLSWSGQRSLHIATALNEWIPKVIQELNNCLWISSEDIRKGTKWSTELADVLDSLKLSIACLTPENLNSTWINFEAGSISKGTSSRVITYLHDLDHADVEQPLGQFNHTLSNREDTLKMMLDINKELGSLSEQALQEQFEAYWPKLKEQLDGIPDKPDSEPEVDTLGDDKRISEILEISRATYKGVKSANSLLGEREIPAGINSFAGRLLMAMCAQWQDLTLAIYSGDEYKHAKEYIQNEGYAKKDGKFFRITDKGLDVVRSLVAKTAHTTEDV